MKLEREELIGWNLFFFSFLILNQYIKRNFDFYFVYNSKEKMKIPLLNIHWRFQIMIFVLIFSPANSICPSNCLTCPSSVCSICENGFYLTSGFDCEPCSTMCKTCETTSPDLCLTCADIRF